MSLSLRRPTYEFSSIAAEREFLRDAVPIGKFVNEDTNIPLKITHVNFNIERNGVKHRTHFFSWMNDPDRNVLIVRRGQPFRLTIGLSRRFCVKDSITLLFNCQHFSGANSSREGLLKRLINPSKTILQEPLKSTFGNNTKILVPIITASNYSIKSTSRWEAVCDYVANNSIQVLVQAADDCIIGTWLMSIFTEFDGVVTWFYDSRKITIHVIFNYTCKGDDVYLDNITDRAEYVEETTGMIFGGCEHHIMVSFWTFGQFDDGVLDLAMLMLLETELTIDVSDRCRASKVAEVIAHAVLQSNQFFKNGNRHREDPWSSAARVIAKYYRTKKPVVYFEQKTIVAVLTSSKLTIIGENLLIEGNLRSLGIPARPVTGYNISTSDFSRIQLRPPKCKSTAEKTSSHRESFRSRKRLMSVTSASSGATPSDVSLKVGKPANMNHLFVIENLKVFSPWVEIFMVRKDLGDHDKGWQAVSNFGPASVAAIQDCNYILDYDTIAFCNQINNTYTYFNFNKRSQSLVPHNEVNGRLGNPINTKKAGANAFGFVGIETTYRSTKEQLAEAYKTGFSTEYTRMTEAHATTPRTNISKFIGRKLRGIAFHFTPIKNVLLGEAIPIHVCAAMSDLRKDWQASIAVYVYAVSPDGKLLKKVKHAVMELKKMIEGGSAKLTIPYSEYRSKIQLNGMFKIIAVAWVSGTSEGLYLMDDFFIISIPPPQLLVSRDAIIISLTNMLTIPMKKIIVTISELGDTRPNVRLKVPMLIETLRKMGRHDRLKFGSSWEANNVHCDCKSSLPSTHLECNEDI